MDKMSFSLLCSERDLFQYMGHLSFTFLLIVMATNRLHFVSIFSLLLSYVLKYLFTIF